VAPYQKWLSPPDPSINHWIAHKERQVDTNKWLLNGDAYKAWKTSGTLFWVRGERGHLCHPFCISLSFIFCFAVGAGKTVMWSVAPSQWRILDILTQ
jgi:hypothetical protein